MLLTEQIYKDMYESILRGKFMPGEKFLTEQEAMERYHASRITIRRAFAMLEESNIINRRQKIGTQINSSFAASSGDVNCIAAVVPLKSQFIRSFLNALCKEAAERNIITVLEPASSGLAQNEALIRLVLHGVRDIIVWGIDRNVDFNLCLRLRILGVNLTFFDQIAPGDIADYVCLDNKAAIAALMEKVSESGAKNVFFFDHEKLNIDTTHERHDCCQRECARRKMRFFDSIPESFPPKSAIVANNGVAALKAVEYGLPVFNIDEIEPARAGIVSYHQPMRELAKKCFFSLQRQRRLGAKWKATEYRIKNDTPFI